MCCDSVGVRGSEKEEEEEMKEGWRPVNASRQIKQINNVKAFMKICCISFSFHLEQTVYVTDRYLAKMVYNLINYNEMW